MLVFSESAYKLVSRKAELYRSQNRKPRLVLLAKSCSGARFALCYDKEADGDIRISYQDLEILLSPYLIEEFGGFSFTTEQFFFAPRLLIKPDRDSKTCDCDHKCNKEVFHEAL
jgi:Fe-S cluster assembly iron-binding protein IscA